MIATARLTLTMTTLGWLAACGSAPPVLSVLPSKAVVIPATIPQQFRANEDVTWSVLEPDGGVIDVNGLYTAPITLGEYTIRASSKSSGKSLDTKLKVIASNSPSTVLINILKAGGYNIFFRHSDAPPNPNQDQLDSTLPEWWKSPDPLMARQLNTLGRINATKTGNTLRRLGIPVAQLLASEFYRCEETANLLRLGLPTETTRTLAFIFYAQEQKNLEKLLATRPIPGKNTVLVGHSHTIPLSLTLEWGDAVVFEPLGDNITRFVGYIRLADWTKTE
jgi:hypothetical protein